MVQIRPHDDVPAAVLIVEGVVRAHRVLVRADGREYRLFEVGVLGDQDRVRCHVKDLVVVAAEQVHLGLELAQRVHAERILEAVALLVAAHLGHVLLREQVAAVRARQVELDALEGHAAVAHHGRAVQRRAKELARALVRGHKGRRLLAHVEQLAVLDHLLGHAERILPRLVLEELLVALLHAVQRISAVLAHGLKAAHGRQRGHHVAVVLGRTRQEQVLQHAVLLKFLAALFKEHLDRRLAVAVNAVVQVARFRKNDFHCLLSLLSSVFLRQSGRGSCCPLPCPQGSRPRTCRAPPHPIRP